MALFYVDEKTKAKLKQNYENALKDANFKKLVSSFDISEEDKINNTSKFKDSVESLKMCQGCKGIAACKNNNIGYVYYPSIYNNDIEFIYVPCKYKKELIKSEENKKTMEKEIESASIKDIDLNDKSRVKLIKWITSFIKNYDKNEKRKGLYLHGNFGCGKTYIISAAFNELAKVGVSKEVVFFSTLLRDLKANFDDLEGTIAYLENVDLLLIDDIGAEKVSEWSRDEILGTILQTRMNNYKTTFFTSNYTIDELENHFAKDGDKVAAARIIERIKYLCEDIAIEGENRRK